jgi:DNA polymerase elongation subunit (family B)
MESNKETAQPSLNKEELRKKIEELTALKNELKNEEQAVKLTMNSIYGAIGNNFFVCFNPEVAESVTLQGQDLIKYSEKILHKYFHDFWHEDKELHEKLGLTQVKKVHRPLVCYGDTDSCFSGSIIIVKNEDFLGKVTFEESFKYYSEFCEISLDERGNEIIEPVNMEVLNFVNEVCFSKVKKIIRHKVSKPKWKIVSSSGKEVIVTDDHSITVFRKGEKIHIKPSEINLETDEILTVVVDI